MTKRPGFSEKIVKAQSGLTAAYLNVFQAIASMDPRDIELAFEANGMTGMMPVKATYVGVSDSGAFMFDCLYWDELQEDGSMFDARVFVRFDPTTSTIKADT